MPPSRLELEHRFHSALVKLDGIPYVFGGRGYGGIDCSSLVVKAMRRAARKRVANLPWMTADQLAKGYRRLTLPSLLPDSSQVCHLAFFDWDEDGIHEHAAVRLLDQTWLWASSTAGSVIRIDPRFETVWRRQWAEIRDSLGSARTKVRQINWAKVKRV